MGNDLADLCYSTQTELGEGSSESFKFTSWASLQDIH